MVAGEERRLRSMLEIATAILLGLVSVATAAGAYQASEWSKQSADYASASTQLRDLSLSSHIASKLASFDDGERVFDALNLEFDIMGGATDVESIRERQEVILDGGSPGLTQEWETFIESGYAIYPTSGAEFVADQLAPTFGANRASAVAYDLAESIGDRGLQITVASVVFALALLLLGVSGANRSLRVSFALAVGGAATFIVGVVISLLAVIG